MTSMVRASAAVYGALYRRAGDKPVKKTHSNGPSGVVAMRVATSAGKPALRVDFEPVFPLRWRGFRFTGQNNECDSRDCIGATNRKPLFLRVDGRRLRSGRVRRIYSHLLGQSCRG